MRTVSTVAELRAALAGPRAAGQRIGLVPTMGALRAGHLALMARARAECDLVVVSLFVNPTQFNDPRDLAAYPRGIERDAEQAGAAGVDVLFTPDATEIYPIRVCHARNLSRWRDRAPGGCQPRARALQRRDHGGGQAVRGWPPLTWPTRARRTLSRSPSSAGWSLTSTWPVEIAVCPTIRDTDGLALSSRNAHLSAPERARGTVAAAGVVADRRRRARMARAIPAPGPRQRGRVALASAGAALEYLEVVTPDTLEPVAGDRRAGAGRGRRPGRERRA